MLTLGCLLSYPLAYPLFSLQKAEELEKQKKAEELALMMKQVAITNDEQIKRKEVMKLRDKEEDQRIAEFVRMKDAAEQVRPRPAEGTAVYVWAGVRVRVSV